MPRHHDRVAMFNPCYRITDMVKGRDDDAHRDPETSAIAVMARGDLLVIQLARAKRFAAAIQHNVARDKFEAMASDIERELESIRPR